MLIWVPISFVLFALICRLIWWTLSPGTETKTYDGKIDTVRTIIPVLLTAGFGEPSMRMKISHRVTWLDLAVVDGGIAVEMPLLTRQQKSERDNYLDICAAAGIDAAYSVAENGETLRFLLVGQPDEIASELEALFVSLFKSKPHFPIKFQVQADRTDHFVFGNRTQPRSGRPAGSVTARTQGRDRTAQLRERENMIFGAGLFLFLPLVVIAGFKTGGLGAAALMALVMWLVRKSYRWLRVKRGGRGVVRETMELVTPALIFATLYTTDAFYIQLVPTTVFVFLAVAVVVGIQFPSFNPFDEEITRNLKLSPSERVAFNAGLSVLFLLGIVLSEYFRRYTALDIWIWYYAYLRFVMGAMLISFAVPSAVYVHSRGKERAVDQK